MILIEAATVAVGYPFRGKVSATPGDDALAVQMKDVSVEWGVNWESCLSVKLTGKKRPQWLGAGDILFASRGSLNYSAVVQASPEPTRPAVASPYFYVVKAQNEQLLPEYLAWWLNQPPCQRHFAQHAEGTLTKSVRRSVLESAPIVLPPLEQQHSIVKLVKNIRRQRQLLEQQIANGDAMQAAIASDLVNANTHSTTHPTTIGTTTAGNSFQ